jgi:hypothetical protein
MVPLSENEVRSLWPAHSRCCRHHREAISEVSILPAPCRLDSEAVRTRMPGQAAACARGSEPSHTECRSSQHSRRGLGSASPTCHKLARRCGGSPEIDARGRCSQFCRHLSARRMLPTAPDCSGRSPCFFIAEPHSSPPGGPVPVYPQGYPGELSVTVVYRLTNHQGRPSLVTEMSASLRSGHATPVNLAQHTYWCGQRRAEACAGERGAGAAQPRWS